MPCSRCAGTRFAVVPSLVLAALVVVLLVMAACDPSVRDAMRTCGGQAMRRKRRLPERAGENLRGLRRGSGMDGRGTVGHPGLAVVVPGDRLQALEADRLTLGHPRLITSHRDLDHYSALGVHGERLDNPLRT